MLIVKKLSNLFVAIKEFVVRNSDLSFTIMVLLAVSMPSLAAEFDLPTVQIPGVTSSSSATEIILAVLKYGVKMLLWIFVVIAGVVYIKNTVKCIAKTRRDEDGKWGEVIGEVVGGAIVVILVILLATWVTVVLN